jgi:hypothetical protein
MNLKVYEIKLNNKFLTVKGMGPVCVVARLTNSIRTHYKRNEDESTDVWTHSNPETIYNVKEIDIPLAWI